MRQGTRYQMLGDSRRSAGGRLGRSIGTMALAAASSALPMMEGLNIIVPVGAMALGADYQSDSNGGTYPASNLSGTVAFCSEFQYYHQASDSPNYHEGGKAVRINPDDEDLKFANWPNNAKRKATLHYKDDSGASVVLPITYGSGASSVNQIAGANWQSDKVAFKDHTGAAWTPPAGTFMSLRQVQYYSDDLTVSGRMVSHYTYGGNTNYINNTTTNEKYSNKSTYCTSGVTMASIDAWLAGGDTIPGNGYFSGFACPHWITGDYETPKISTLFEGDSITAQGVVEMLGHLLVEDGIECGIINNSRHRRQLAHVIADGASAYDVAEWPSKVNVIFLCLGPNDVSDGRTKAEFMADVNTYTSRVKAVNPRVLIFGVPPPPRASWTGDPLIANQTANTVNLAIVRWLAQEPGEPALSEVGLDGFVDPWWTPVAWGQNSNTKAAGLKENGLRTGKWDVESFLYSDPTQCTSYGDITTDTPNPIVGGPFQNSFWDAASLDTAAKARKMAGMRIVFTSGDASGRTGQVDYAEKWFSGTPTYSKGQYSLKNHVGANITPGSTGKIIAYFGGDFVHPDTWCHIGASIVFKNFIAGLTPF